MSMTPDERVNHPDWVVRLYGPEFAERLDRIRVDSERRRHAEFRRELPGAILVLAWFVARCAATAYVAYVLVNFVRECAAAGC
jgi:hypothetical protein